MKYKILNGKIIRISNKIMIINGGTRLIKLIIIAVTNVSVIGITL